MTEKFLSNTGDKNINIEQIIEKIILFKDNQGIQLLNKFSVEYLISIIEKDKITQLSRSMKDYDKKGVDIIDFVRVFLNLIEHQEHETLYLVMALVDFFRVISENLNMATYLTCSDITDYICMSFGESTVDEYLLPTKKLPESKKFNIDSKKIREIDIEAPVVFGQNEDLLRRIEKGRVVTDSSHHNNHNIKMGQYAKEIRKVLINL